MITDLSPLSSLTNIHTLVLSKNWGIADVTPLSGLRNLEHLDLHHTGILDLGPLAKLHELDTLILRENDISDLSPLSSLTKLRVLNLMHNLVRDVTPLASMTGLEKLGLQFNPLSDLTGLSALHQLKDLNLQYNPLDDLSEILDLRNLESLDLKLIDFPAEVYCRQIPAILDNNPGMWLGCNANLNAPENVTASSGDFANKVLIGWDAVCNVPPYTNYYRVYRSASETGEKTALGSWQTSTEFADVTAAPGISYVYWVQTAVSDSGSPAGPYSVAITGWVTGRTSLTVSSSAGGQVVDPGDGSFNLDENGTLSLRALPVDPHLYVFAGWSGTAVEAGKVADPKRAATE